MKGGSWELACFCQSITPPHQIPGTLLLIPVLGHLWQKCFSQGACKTNSSRVTSSSSLSLTALSHVASSFFFFLSLSIALFYFSLWYFSVPKGPPRHLAYVCDGIVEVHSEALHQEDPRPRVCLMDSAGCHRSAYSTALMLRPGFPWAASSQDPAWWRLLVLAHVCLTRDSFTSQLSISHRSG